MTAGVQEQDTCYMCDRVATTREHSPPYSFFPDDKRVNLITVPSCVGHNNKNSKDVEYVRNLVCSDFHTNEIGVAMFDKARRSFDRSPKLFRKTFSRLRVVMVNGEETAVYKINLPRFKRVIRAIASGLYLHDFGEKFQYYWLVYNATMVSENEGFRDLPDNINPRMRQLVRRMPAAERDTNQPDVFRYSVYRGDEPHKVFYRLVFYGGVDIYAFGAAPGLQDEFYSPKHLRVNSLSSHHAHAGTPIFVDIKAVDLDVWRNGLCQRAKRWVKVKCRRDQIDQRRFVADFAVAEKHC